jgi:DNA-binding NarL/FixJ family response regulator
MVDDQPLVRGVMRLLLTQSGRFDVVGESSDAGAAIAELRDLVVDVVLLDISMPGMSGLDALPLIRKARPESRVVILTDSTEPDFVKRALADGASGYLSKADAPEALIAALDRVLAGECPVSPRFAHT